MDSSKDRNIDASHGDGSEGLRRENEILSGQIKRLIKTESKLYAYQEQLDAQLREYKGLYELNRRFVETLDIGKLFQYTCEYVINGLEYERVIIFQLYRDKSGFGACARDGFYEAEDRGKVDGLFIRSDDPILSFIDKENEYLVCSAESSGAHLQRYRSFLAMNEYVIFPLVSHGDTFALLVVGNSEHNAGFYHRISGGDGELLGVGNLAGLLSSTIQNRILYSNLNDALEQARDAEAKYRSIFENAVEGIYQASVGGRFISCNPATAAILGYDSPEDLIRSISDIETQLYVDPKRRRELLDLLRRQGEVKNFEVEFYRKNGEKQWILLSVRSTADEKGELTLLDGIMLDIAERKMMEDVIMSSLREKDTLLREIHHRVKNNLQIISSLLDLQSISLADAPSRRFLEECQGRIKSIALIHEKLYGTTDVASVNFSDYLNVLVHQLCSMYLHNNSITLDFAADEVDLGIDDAVPCGLITNELVTNSLKYAFPAGGEGVLSVHLAIIEDGTVTLSLADNGVGLPPGLDFRNTETLGLQLVNLLVKQIGGSIKLKQAPGTAYEITFRRRSPSRRDYPAA